MDDSKCLCIHQCTARKHIHSVCKTINMILGEKYLHIPMDTEEMRRKVSEFEMRFGMTRAPQAYGCIGGTHLPINDHPKIFKIIFVTNSIFPSTFRLYVILKGTSWMSSANGLDQNIIPKCLQIPASTAKWKLDNVPKHLLTFFLVTKLCWLFNWRPSLSLNTFLHEGVSDKWARNLFSIACFAQYEIKSSVHFADLKFDGDS